MAKAWPTAPPPPPPPPPPPAALPVTLAGPEAFAAVPAAAAGGAVFVLADIAAAGLLKPTPPPPRPAAGRDTAAAIGFGRNDRPRGRGPGARSGAGAPLVGCCASACPPPTPAPPCRLTRGLRESGGMTTQVLMVLVQPGLSVFKIDGFRINAKPCRKTYLCAGRAARSPEQLQQSADIAPTATCIPLLHQPTPLQPPAIGVSEAPTRHAVGTAWPHTENSSSCGALPKVCPLRVRSCTLSTGETHGSSSPGLPTHRCRTACFHRSRLVRSSCLSPLWTCLRTPKATTCDTII